MKLRQVITALQREGYARKVKPPPDTLGGKQLKMSCLRQECPERATINYAAQTDHGREGLYNCRHCGLSGDAVSLILAMAGNDLDPYRELSEKDRVASAISWADQYAGKQQAKPEAEPYVPSWLRDND